MGIDLQLFVEPGWIRAVAMGEFSLEEAQRTFLELMEGAVRHKTEKILVDGRGLKGNPTVIERFYFGGFAADTVETRVLDGKVRDPQFAFILSEPVLVLRQSSYVGYSRLSLMRASSAVNCQLTLASR